MQNNHRVRDWKVLVCLMAYQSSWVIYAKTIPVRRKVVELFNPYLED